MRLPFKDNRFFFAQYSYLQHPGLPINSFSPSKAHPLPPERARQEYLLHETLLEKSSPKVSGQKQYTKETATIIEKEKNLIFFYFLCNKS